MKKRRQKKPKPDPVIGNGFVLKEDDNPYYNRAHPESATNPRRIQVVYNPKESPAAYYRNKGWISDPQFMAASKFRMLYEKAGGIGAKAIDYSREHVDGGMVSDGLTDSRLDAARELKAAHDALGRAGHDLVQSICGQGLWVYQIEPGQYGQRQAMKRLRDCLDTLAHHWGYSSRIRAHRAA